MSEVVHNAADSRSRNPVRRQQAHASMLLRLPHQILSVVRFEFRRTATFARLINWVGLIFFPVIITALVTHYQGRGGIDRWGFLLYVLVPQASCLLGLLLWVAPNVNSELEGRTWFYLTARPSGRLALLLGKYINGVLWSTTAGWAGATFSIGVLILATIIYPASTISFLPPGSATSTVDATLHELFALWLMLLLLVVLSSLAYGAICTLVAVIIPRRAMMICVAYVLVAEIFLSNIPALINELTEHHRLINILARTLEFQVNPEIPNTLDNTATWIHFIALACYAVALLTAANIIICCREYITSDQS